MPAWRIRPPGRSMRSAHAIRKKNFRSPPPSRRPRHRSQRLRPPARRSNGRIAAAMARIRVDTDASGQRVDHLVAVALPGLSVAAARRLIASGAVRVDGRLARKGEHLTAGQTVEVDEAGVALPGAEALRVRPDPQLAIAILQIDPAFVAFEKPAGVPSHPRAVGELGTAANAIAARFPECAAASPDPREGGLVHRLDTAPAACCWPRATLRSGRGC